MGKVRRKTGRDRANRTLSQYFNDVRSIRLLSRAEENELGRRAQNGDFFARQKLVEANLRFVIAIAKKYRRSGLPLLDLINEGNLGLIEAARRFDPEKNVRFTSYAVWWIRQAIFRYISMYGQIYRIPPKMLHVFWTFSKERTNGSTKQDVDILADELGVKRKTLEISMTCNAPPISLETIAQRDSESPLGKLLPQNSEPSPQVVAIKNDMKHLIVDCLKILSKQEQTVIALRFGLRDGKEQTLQEIGKGLHLTRERIRQIEAHALEKLRDSTATRVLHQFAG